MTEPKRIFDLFKGIASKIDEPIYYYKVATIPAAYNESKNLLTLKITVGGIYLVLSAVSGTVDAADSILSNYVAGGTNIAGMQTRGTLNAGGGVCAWFLKQIKEGDILTLSSYGYYSKSYDLTGHMVAIRLGK